MSKYLYFILLAFAFPACSSDDGGLDEITPDYGDDAIRFAVPEVVMGAPEVTTRSTLLNAVTENTTFGVFGYCVPYSVNGDNVPSWGDAATEWVGKKEHSHADVMYNQPIFYDGAKCVYRGHEDNPNLPAHWYTQADLPAGTAAGNINFEQFSYSFIAYHPYSPTGEGNFRITPGDAATRGVPKLTYTMPYSVPADRSRELGIDDVADVMWALKTDHLRGNGAVHLEFQHVLTGLRLQINNYNPVDNSDVNKNAVTIHSITMEGDFYRSATIDFASATPVMTVGTERYSGTFHFLKAADAFTVPANSARVVGTPGKEDGTTILLLPNADAKAASPTDAIPYLGANKTIAITYSYAGDTQRTTKHVRNFSLGRIPEQGICYTLNLNFIGNQLLLMFTADSIEYWEPGSDNHIIIN